MDRDRIIAYHIPCDREIATPFKIPTCCLVGGLRADEPICIKCEQNMKDGVSHQFTICQEMNRLVCYKASGYLPEELMEGLESAGNQNG